MPRKPKDDTPAGGWLPPGSNLDRKPERYAAGTKVVRGKLEWVWKPVDQKYLDAKAAVNPGAKEEPKVRVRQRVRK